MAKVMIAGTFDNFHVGHQAFIAQAIKESLNPKNLKSKEEGSVVIIIARDETVKRIKGKRPKNSEDKRLATIEEYLSLYPFSFCQIPLQARLGRSDANFSETIREESPDILLLGYDQQVNVERLKHEFPDLIVERAQAYKPEVFKSSRF